MENIYDKNLSALNKVNRELSKKIEDIKSNEKFEVFQGNNPEVINILDTTTNTPLHQNPTEELKFKKQEYKKLREYPFLYFFGVGNGYEIKFLLENLKLERLLVIEPEIELIYILLNLQDFSADIKKYRLIILLEEQLTFALGIDIFGNHKSRFYARVYDLHITTSFYENYKKEIENTNHILTKALYHVISVSGNDVTDSLVGVKHHIKNLPLMLKSAKFSELKKKKNSNVAIVVSTGPSLQKQLPLLKKIQNHVTIISVDASLPILEKHDIKPDIVTSIERISATSIFFKKTSQDFQKDIICVSASLQHEDVLNAIKGIKLLVMRPFHYNRYFELDDYGYLGSGMSSANLAHELSIAMGYKTCILIGQDLAFAKNGTSHSKDHILGIHNVDKKKADTISIEAYGKYGNVESAFAWILFKNYFEQTIEHTKKYMKTINSTEGGAKIQGSVEMPFTEVVEKYIDTKSKKIKISIDMTKSNEFKKNLELVDKKIDTLVKEGENILNKIEEIFTLIFTSCQKLENKTREESLSIFSISETAYLIQEIESIRNFINKNKIYQQFYYEICQSDLLHNELELAKIKVRYIDNPKDNQQKALEWILRHREWLFTIAGTLRNTIDIIKEARSKWST